MKLEQLLRYFHGACAASAAAMLADARLSLLANVHCVAAEAFIQTNKPHALEAVLLAATAKYFEEVKMHCVRQKMATPAPGEPWTCYTAVAAEKGDDNATVAAKRSASKIMPKVKEFNEDTGKPMIF